MGQQIMDRVDTVTSILATLGNLVRRTQAETLDQDTFYELAGQMRRDLKALRVDLGGDASEIELTDLGQAVGNLLDSGAIKPASALLDQLPDRARTYGSFVVIDGDLPFEPLTQQGA